MRHTRTPTPTAWTIAAALFIAGGLSPGARAQDRPAQPFDLAAAASACMSCHGTNGKTEGVGYMIGGKSATTLTTALIDFREGRRSGSVMPPITRAFSSQELQALAQEFAKYK